MATAAIPRRLPRAKGPDTSMALESKCHLPPAVISIPVSPPVYRNAPALGWLQPLLLWPLSPWNLKPKLVADSELITGLSEAGVVTTGQLDPLPLMQRF